MEEGGGGEEPEETVFLEQLRLNLTGNVPIQGQVARCCP